MNRFVLIVLIWLAVIGLVFFGGYLFRVLLPKDHTLQARLTDEAISNRVTYTMRNFKGILCLFLLLYFIAITVIYS